jgi:hypothetical protein
MKLKSAFGIITLVTSFVTLPVLGNPVDYHIIEQNEQLTTDIPAANITGNPDNWVIILLITDTVTGSLVTPESAGETGVNEITYNGAISVRSDVSSQEAVGGSMTLTDQDGVHNVIFEDLPAATSGVPDSGSTIIFLGIAFVGLAALPRRVRAV